MAGVFPTPDPTSSTRAQGEPEPADDEAGRSQAISFVRFDGSTISSATLLSAKQQSNAGSSRRARRFYKSQNDLIDALVADMANSEQHRLLEGDPVDSVKEELHWHVRAAIRASFFLNVALLIAKLIAAIASGSMSVIASAADSALDLISGAVLFYTQRAMSRVDRDKYPEGRARLEPIGILIFSTVMAMSSLQIILESVKTLADIIQEGTTLDLTPSTLAILGSTIVSKLAALLFCRAIAKQHNSSSVEAYAQDHRNDVLTNLVGVIAVVLAWTEPDKLAVLDPIGAILIALWILYSWSSTALEHVAKLAGLTAPPDFVRRLTHLVFHHDARVQKVDTCRAYHFGERFLVEVEVVMHEETNLRDSHDCGIALQHKIERLEEVERAFVHVDYQIRNVDDHDSRSPLARKTFLASRREAGEACATATSVAGEVGACEESGSLCSAAIDKV